MSSSRAEDAPRGAAHDSRPPRFVLADAGASPPTTRCYWVVPGRLLAGAYPGSADPATHAARVTSLWNAGIRTFVNLMEEDETNNDGSAFAAYSTAVEALATRGHESASCVRFPIRDVSVPSRETMVAILDRIDEDLAAGRALYVHCFGGMGRTGTVVGCWLLRHGLATRDDVIDVLSRLRASDAKRAAWASPQTREQVRFVTTWEG